MPYHNNTTIIKQTHDDKDGRNDKDAVINDARNDKNAGRLLYKIFYISLYL